MKPPMNADTADWRGAYLRSSALIGGLNHDHAFAAGRQSASHATQEKALDLESSDGRGFSLRTDLLAE